MTPTAARLRWLLLIVIYCLMHHQCDAFIPPLRKNGSSHHRLSSKSSQSSQPPRKHVLYSSSNNDNSNSNVCRYKDDCFGFMSFLCGMAAGDVVFTGTFVAFSLAGATASQLGLLPPDTKRPKIVDRKVPAAIAALTILVSSPPLSEAIAHLITSLSQIDIPAPNPIARPIQLGVGAFSIITGCADIRWRDRFDYPQEYR